MAGETDYASQILGNGQSSEEDNTNAVDNVIPITSGDNADESHPLAKILKQYKGKKGPQLSRDDFNRGRNAPNGVQAFSTYFPSEENNIQKGSYSGSMIGSNPIYAPSQLMPYGLIDARQKALSDAADQKAAEQSAFANAIMSEKVPTTAHAAVQPQITDMFFKGLKEDVANAQKKYGSDWARQLYNDPEHRQKMQTINDVAKYEDVAVKHVAALEHGSETGEYELTPEIQQKIAEFKNGIHGLASMSGDPEAQAKAKEIFDFEPLLNATKIASHDFKALEPEVRQSVSSITPQEGYNLIKEGKATTIEGKRLLAAANDSYESHFSNKPGAMPIEKYREMFLRQYAPKNEETLHTPSNGEGVGSGSGSRKGVKYEGDYEELPNDKAKYTFRPIDKGIMPTTQITDPHDQKTKITVRPTHLNIDTKDHSKTTMVVTVDLPEAQVKANEAYKVKHPDPSVSGYKLPHDETLTLPYQEAANIMKTNLGMPNLQMMIDPATRNQVPSHISNKYSDLPQGVWEYNGHSAPESEWLGSGWTKEQLQKNAKKK